MQSGRHHLEIYDLDLFVKVHPDGDIPVIALHGWLDNSASFDELTAELSDDFRVAAVDLPGHGKSDWRAPADSYYFTDWVDVVLGVADALDMDRFSIIGHSMGGAVASLVAPVAEGRIERMVFLDALGPRSANADEAVDQLQRALKTESRHRQRSPRRYESIHDMARLLGHSRGELPGELFEAIARQAAVEHDDGTFSFGHDPRLKAPSRLMMTERQVLGFLDRISCPTLLIRPRQGWPVDDADFSPRIAAIDDLCMERIEGSHYAHIEHPAAVARLIDDFLTQSPPAR